jgi:hypothetical protein
VCVNQPGAVGLEIDVGVANVGLALTKGFDLGTVEDQTGLMSLKNMVVIGGGAVLGDDVFAGLCGLL